MKSSTLPTLDLIGLHHLGIAVRDLAAVRRHYTQFLGFHVEHEERLEEQLVEVCFLVAGSSRIELLAPLRLETTADTPLVRFLEKRGEGLHHVCYQVVDLRQSLAVARRLGIEQIDSEPRPGARGSSIAFLAPSSLSGVLTELCQEGEP